MHENRHTLDVRKDELKQLVLRMSELTAESFERALKCFEHCDRDSAEALIARDEAINAYYDETERTGFYVIASQQPVARDLREIVVAMHIASEIERIADHAANIARIRLEIARSDLSDLCVADIGNFGRETLSMYRLAVAAYLAFDTGEAEQLRIREIRADQVSRSITNALFACMKKDPALIEDGSRALWIVHTLERIADRTTNIAEQVVYAATGKEEKMN